MADNETGDLNSSLPSLLSTTEESPMPSPSENITLPGGKIFLQTAAAQGIAGFFAFAAIIVTCHQVSSVGNSVISVM